MIDDVSKEDIEKACDTFVEIVDEYYRDKCSISTYELYAPLSYIYAALHAVESMVLNPKYFLDEATMAIAELLADILSCVRDKRGDRALLLLDMIADSYVTTSDFKQFMARVISRLRYGCPGQ